jgi:hypothetical protein
MSLPRLARAQGKPLNRSVVADQFKSLDELTSAASMIAKGF